MKTALVIAYKGTAYAGWQVQDKLPSVQKTLQNAVEAALCRKVNLSGCSRTDSGVHANEYWCHLDVLSDIPEGKLPLALNIRLPEDISVLRAVTVEDGFHARYSSKGKQYVYVIHNSYIKSPFTYETAWQYHKPLDARRLTEIGNDYIGKHDFAAFMSAHSKIKDTVRNVSEFRAERDGEDIRIYVTADGFLYNMVRIMVGTALEIHSGRIKMPLKEIIERKERKNAGKTAPALGLFLNKVIY